MQPEVYADWGRRVRDRRKAMQLTQESFGARCELDQSTVSRLERGEIHPSDAMKWKIAGALGMTIEQLFPFPNVRPPMPDDAKAAS